MWGFFLVIRSDVQLLQRAGSCCERPAVRTAAPAATLCGAPDETASGPRVRPIIHFSLLTTTALGGTIAAALLWAASPAQAACAPIANGIGVPASGTTVTCSGATVDQNGADGYGDGNQDGLTVNVQSGASVAGTDSGIRLRDNNTIQNSGSISAIQRYGVRADNGSITVVNNTGATISGDQVGVYAEGNATVINSGTITGTAVIYPLSVGVQSYGLINITNNAGGFITGTAWGVMSVNDGGTVNNYGTITATGAFGNAAAVYVQGSGSLLVNNYSGGVLTGYANGVSGGGQVTVNNWGTITGGTGPAIYGDNAVVTNNAGGSITGGASGGVYGGSSATVDNSGAISSTDVNGAAVYVSGGPANVTNRAGGTIQGYITASGNVTVVNSGSIVAPLAIFTSAGSVHLTNNAGGSIQSSFDALEAGGPVTVVNSGTITATRFAINSDVTATITNNVGGIIQGGSSAVLASGVQISNFGTIIGDSGINSFPSASSNIFNAGTITGTGGTAIFFSGTNNTLTIAPTSVINGLVEGGGTGTFQLGGSGTGAFNVGNIGAGQQYDGFTTFNKIGDSTWFLSGTGAQTWNVLSGTLAGNATVGNVTVASGGTFAPGNGTAGSSMTVNGNLAFQSGALYLVQLNPTTASFANVTGTSTLAGTTLSIFANGTYVSRRYTILSSVGGISGTFNSLVNTNLPSGFNATLSYDPTHAYLDLALNFTGPSFGAGLNGNQQNVANTVTNFFNTTGSIPAAFGALTPAGLTQVSGELATGTQQTTFHAMNLFMGLLTDPFIGNRGYCDDPAMALYCRANDGGASAYASGDKPRSGAERDAYAAVYGKAPLAQNYNPRWSVWAAGYGGSETTNGNAVTGSNTATSRIYGTAVGADYLLSPSTIAGFSLAGGGTNFSVANGGTGHSDLFQAGVFFRHTVHAAYLTGALAYGWQDVTTNRTMTIAGIDQLQARFHANASSGRLEGGYRFVTPWMGITPYAAGQFTTYGLPAYAEQVLSGANTFALNYAAKGVTASRSELGLRTDNSYALATAILTLRSRFAWAHNFNTDASIAPTFQALPGASFVVNGAAQARDAALTTLSAELKWRNGFSLAGVFEGEFSSTTTSYAGKGVARYTW